MRMRRLVTGSESEAVGGDDVDIDPFGNFWSHPVATHALISHQEKVCGQVTIEFHGQHVAFQRDAPIIQSFDAGWNSLHGSRRGISALKMFSWACPLDPEPAGFRFVVTDQILDVSKDAMRFPQFDVGQGLAEMSFPFFEHREVRDNLQKQKSFRMRFVAFDFLPVVQSQLPQILRPDNRRFFTASLSGWRVPRARYVTDKSLTSITGVRSIK